MLDTKCRAVVRFDRSLWQSIEISSLLTRFWLAICSGVWAFLSGARLQKNLVPPPHRKTKQNNKARSHTYALNTHTHTLDLVQWKLGHVEAQFFHVRQQVTYNTSTSRRNTTTVGSPCCIACNLESTGQAMPSHALIAQSLKVNLPCCVLLPVENCHLKHAHALIATSKLQ